MSTQAVTIPNIGDRDAKTKGLLFLYVVLVTAFLFLLLTDWAYDDPFITYRYARNLSDGLGFVYNPGERILSTTTPLFTISLALLSNLWADIPHLANLIGAISLALGGVFLWDLAHIWKTPLVGWVALLLYPTFPLLFTTMGSETPLYLALCLGSFSLYARKRYSWTAVFSALAVLTRPDGVLVPILLACDYMIGVRRLIPWKVIVLFLAITIPWFLFAWLYFGSPLPVTLVAKQHQGSMAISQQFLRGLITTVYAYLSSWQHLLAAALALVGIIWMLMYARRWILFLSWPVFYTISYSILGVSRYFWYYAPLVPGFIVATGLGVTAIAGLAQKSKYFDYAPQGESMGVKSGSSFSEVKKRLPILSISVLLIVLAFAQVNELWRFKDQSDPRKLIYQAVGGWLNDYSSSEATIAALEIGIIGYYADRPMVDFAGLLYPEVASQLSIDTTYEDAAMWAVERYEPDYVVLPKGGYQSMKESYLSERCRIVQHFPGEPYGFTAQMNIYECY